jgi:hypothetical protein
VLNSVNFAPMHHYLVAYGVGGARAVIYITSMVVVSAVDPPLDRRRAVHQMPDCSQPITSKLSRILAPAGLPMGLVASTTQVAVVGIRQAVVVQFDEVGAPA